MLKTFRWATNHGHEDGTKWNTQGNTKSFPHRLIIAIMRLNSVSVSKFGFNSYIIVSYEPTTSALHWFKVSTMTVRIYCKGPDWYTTELHKHTSVLTHRPWKRLYIRCQTADHKFSVDFVFVDVNWTCHRSRISLVSSDSSLRMEKTALNVIVSEETNIKLDIMYINYIYTFVFDCFGFKENSSLNVSYLSLIY